MVRAWRRKHAVFKLNSKLLKYLRTLPKGRLYPASAFKTRSPSTAQGSKGPPQRPVEREISLHARLRFSRSTPRPNPCCAVPWVPVMSLAAVSALRALCSYSCSMLSRRQDPHPHGVQGRAGFLRHEAEVSPLPCSAASAGHRHVSRWENRIALGRGVLLNRGLKEASPGQVGNEYVIGKQKTLRDCLWPGAASVECDPAAASSGALGRRAWVAGRRTVVACLDRGSSKPCRDEVWLARDP